MKINVLNKNEIENEKVLLDTINKDEKHIIISISSSTPAQIKHNNSLSILRLDFEDFDYRQEKAYYNMKDNNSSWCFKLFNGEHASKILSFVNEFILECEHIIIHCDAGISRSSAIAGAFGIMLNKKNDEFFSSKYIPNKKIYIYMLEEYYSNPEKYLNIEKYEYRNK